MFHTFFNLKESREFVCMCTCICVMVNNLSIIIDRVWYHCLNLYKVTRSLAHYCFCTVLANINTVGKVSSILLLWKQFWPLGTPESILSTSRCPQTTLRSSVSVFWGWEATWESAPMSSRFWQKERRNFSTSGLEATRVESIIYKH